MISHQRANTPPNTHRVGTLSKSYTLLSTQRPHKYMREKSSQQENSKQSPWKVLELAAFMSDDATVQ